MSKSLKIPRARDLNRKPTGSQSETSFLLVYALSPRPATLILLRSSVGATVTVNGLLGT